MALRSKDLRADEKLRIAAAEKQAYHAKHGVNRKEGPVETTICRRHRPGTMNKGEGLYADYLDTWKLSGLIVAWWFEGITLRLAEHDRYTPDFMVVDSAGQLWLYDVKGRKGETYYATEDSKVKIRSAAGMFPWFRFTIVWPAPGGGAWRSKDIRP